MKNQESKGFNFALPFDPFRLLLAVLEKFGFILLAALVCAVLGVAYAKIRLGDTYSASVTLASEGWHTKRADEGSTYVPMPITDEAVVIAANAEEVFEMAAKMIDPTMPGGAVRARVGLEQLPGEGLFSVHATTSESREMTHKVVTSYAQAIKDYTAKLRQDVAREKYEELEKLLKVKQAASAEISKEIKDYALQEGIMDPLGANGAELSALGAIKKSRDDAKVDLRGINDQTINVIRQSVIVPKNQELVALLAVRTESHGSVIALKQEIRSLEQKLAASRTSGEVDLNEFEALLDPKTELTVRNLKEKRAMLENRIASYTEQLEASELEAGGLSEQSLVMARKLKILDLRINSSAVINGQMGDAEFFANNAPPALSTFYAPSVEEVYHKSLKKKAITLAILGMMGGAGAVLGLSLVLELMGRKVRTPMQAAIAAGTYPKLVYPPSRKTDNEIALRNFWIRGVARFLPAERRMIFPVIGEVPNETGFWSNLFSSLQDDKQRVVFVDFSTKTLDLGLPTYNSGVSMPVSQIDPSQFSSADLQGMVANFPEGHVLIIRWDMNPTTMLVELAPHIDRQYILTSQEVSLSTVEEESRNYRDVFGDADGLVLVNSKRPKRSQMIVNRLQDWYLESYRRRDLRATNAPLAH